MIAAPLKALLVANALPILTVRFKEGRARELLEDAFLRYESAVPPPQHSEENLGGRLMVRCAALTAAVYRVLIDDGLSEIEARALTANVTGSIYDKMAEVPWLTARLTARSPLTRLRRATGAFRRFPFGAPSYRMEDVASDDKTVALDVKRCPVAEYFRDQGLAELCVESFCNLDFPLAAKWGARLDRTMTLAAGDDHCNFRWRLDPNAEGAGT